ncbi:MAG: dienelactone hydrolase family protein [Caldilineales bacterium]|nr:dienelactone hydrolase family protein [Caldilineales bacterium]
MNRVESQELVRSYQTGEITRRDFLKTATILFGSMTAANTLLAACAVPVAETPRPVVDATQPAAEPGMTSEGDLVSGIVTYPGPENQELMGYLTYEDDGQAKPAVIVIQEWWGLNEHIKDVANRFAQAGFVALAPDLYNGVATTEPDEARKLSMELGMRDAVGEIQSAIAYLQAQDFVTGKAGVVGFCMGGGLVLQTAANDDAGRVGAAIPFYGSPLSAADARRVQAPVLSFLGSADRIPASGYESMHAIFDEDGVPNEFVLYDGAQHAFFNDTRASYDAEAAADAWARAVAWFREYLS